MEVVKLSINSSESKKENSTFLSPLNWDMKTFILALKDSAEAFVLLKLSIQLNMKFKPCYRCLFKTNNGV